MGAVRASSPAGSSNAWRSRARWRSSRACCCWTNRCRTSTPSCARLRALELKRLQRRLGITTIFVTHDQQEAMTIADRLAVLEQGAIRQVGTPRDLYDTPIDRFVAEFVGSINVYSGPESNPTWAARPR